MLNFRRRNPQGLAMSLIFMWLLGDAYKLSYYSSQDAPIQLVACSAFQILTDIAILFQFWLYAGVGKKSEENGKQFQDGLYL